MKRQIIQIGSPRLTQKCKIVTDLKSKETLQVIEDLLDTCKANKSIAAGLSAPQIDYDLAICVCRRVDLEENNKKVASNDLWEIMINPKIINKSEKESLFWEGCLSIGKGKKLIYGPVYRPDQVEVEYLDISGKKKTLSGTGFFSHLIQHELDHLEGKLFLSYVSNPDNLWLSSDLDKYLDQNGTYPTIS
jgi:peptide deformylase